MYRQIHEGNMTSQIQHTYHGKLIKYLIHTLLVMKIIEIMYKLKLYILPPVLGFQICLGS